MARKQRFPKLSGDEAIAALRSLVARGTIKTRHIAEALKRRKSLVREIRERLEQLGGEGLRFLHGRESFEKRAPRRRAKRVSAAARAAWKAQGRYLGAVRALSAANRAKVKAIREKAGVAAAIAAARKLRAV